MSTAGGLLCAAIGSHVYDDLYQVLDAMLGEGGYTILADPVDVQHPSSGNMSIDSS